MIEKAVCFAGHRDEFRNIGIEEKLEAVIIDLIKQGYNVFYDGGKGCFDNISASIVIKLKHKYPHIRIIKVLTYYHSNKEKWELPSCYDGSILPDIEEFYPKVRITKRNEWIIDNSEVLVCHITETYKSGAFNTLKYAKKRGKLIISV